MITHLSDHPEGLLQRPSQNLQLLGYAFHSHRVREEQQLLRCFDLSGLHDIQSLDRVDLQSYNQWVMTGRENSSLPMLCEILQQVEGKAVVGSSVGRQRR